MEKTNLLVHFPREKWKKILLEMKITILLVLVLSFGASASIYSQNQRVSMQFEDATILEVLNEIKTQTGLRFIYNEDKLDDLQAINLDAGDSSVEEVLEEIFEETDLECRFQDDVIMIVDRMSKTVVKEQEQKKEVKGTVTDDQGIPLPGVSVVIKGTNTGVATNIDGEYVLELENENVVLVFSFVGMIPQEIAYTGQTSLNVTLVADSEQMAEVVVTGYQTLSRERTTGSFAQIKQEEFEQRVTTDITSSLEGLVPGLYVDGDNEITIRGVGTLYGDSSPLIVVDGFPVEADLSTINPDDIASVTVLKDAAATSIWGVKAANGVIVLTTKMGSLKEKVQVNASYYLTIEEKPDFNDLDLMSTSDQIDFDVDTYDGGNWVAWWVPYIALNPLQTIYKQKNDGVISQAEYDSKVAKMKSKNAYDQMARYFLQNAVSHKANVSITGGGERGTYYLSTSYQGNESTSVGNSNDRININLKNNYKLSDKFTLSTSANFTYTKADNNGIPIRTMLTKKPYEFLVDENDVPIQYYNKDKAKLQELEEKGYLPYSTSFLDVLKHNDNTNKGFDARIQLGLNYKISSDLVFDTKFQYERGYSKSRDFKSIKHPDTRNMINTYTLEDGSGGLIHQLPKGGWLKSGKNDHEAWTWRNQLSYNASFDNDKHQISAIAGAEVRKYVTYNFNEEKFGYDPQTLTYVPMDESFWLGAMQNAAWYGRTGFAYPPLSSYGEVDNRDVSFFMNGSYTYDGKYTLTASGRVDQSNLFGSSKEFRYKPLWSTGLSWRMSEEEFLSEVDWLDNLMIRATYGVGGSTNKNFFPALMGDYGISFSTGDPYIRLSNPANDKLKWETAYMFNIGVDWSIMNNRIWGSFEYYNKDSEDLIGRQSLDPTNGWDAASVNFASINNKGVEISLNATPIKRNGFVWETNLNIANNKNEVVDVGVSGASLNNYLETLPTFERLEVFAKYGLMGRLGIPIKGKPLTRVYAYKYDGLDANGQPKIFNENGEAISWAAFSGDPAALKYMGTSTPTVFGNFKNTFSYKGLTLAINMTYKFGHVFRAPRSVGSVTHGPQRNNLVNRWKEAGDEAYTNVPKYDLYMNRSYEDYYRNADINVLDGDLIRLNDLSLSYDLPKGLIAKTPLKSLNVKFQARNLWLWTANDEDIDPDKVPVDQHSFSFPTPRSFVVGLKATF
jgi:TonB-linked SusC/RagA family outer membrane protein